MRTNLPTFINVMQMSTIATRNGFVRHYWSRLNRELLRNLMLKNLGPKLFLKNIKLVNTINVHARR
jgi:hypothetical protein